MEQWTFTQKDDIQTFTVPKDGIYTFDCYAPKGGRGTYGKDGQIEEGGYGTHVGCDFHLKQGESLKLIVGSQGQDADSSPYDEKHYDKTTGGAGGITGVFMNDLPLIVACGGQGGHDLSYLTHQGLDYTPVSTQLASLPNQIPSRDKLTPSTFCSKGSFTRNEFSVKTGFGAPSNWSNMDDTCGFVGIVEENFVIKGGTVESNTSGSSHIDIKLKEETPYPSLVDTKIKGFYVPQAFSEDSYGELKILCSGIFIELPQWVDTAYHYITPIVGNTVCSESLGYRNSSFCGGTYCTRDESLDSLGLSRFDGNNSGIIVTTLLYGKYGIIKCDAVELLLLDLLRDFKVKSVRTVSGGRIGGKTNIRWSSCGLPSNTHGVADEINK